MEIATRSFNIPTKLLERLNELAKVNYRSVNQEVVKRLEESINAEKTNRD